MFIVDNIIWYEHLKRRDEQKRLEPSCAFFLAEEHAVDKPVDQHLEGIIANEDAKEDGHELILRREDERVGNAVLCVKERHYRKQQARLQHEERLETQLVGSLRKFGGQRPGL